MVCDDKQNKYKIAWLCCAPRSFFVYIIYIFYLFYYHCLRQRCSAKSTPDILNAMLKSNQYYNICIMTKCDTRTTAKRCLLGWSLRNFGCWAVVCSTRPLTLHYSGYLNVLSRVCLYQKYYFVYRSDFLGIWVQWHLNPWLGHSYLRHRYPHDWQVLMSDTEEILEEDYPDLGMPICLMLKRTSCLLINLKQPMQK